MYLFLHGTQACIFLQKFDCEDFLPYLLSLQIDQNQEPEALKSQAVLARTNFIYQESQGESSQEILENTFSEIFDTASWLRLLFLPDQYYDAVEKTKNQILTFQETPAWSLITVLIVEKPAMERKFSTILLILTCSLWIVPGILMLLII